MLMEIFTLTIVLTLSFLFIYTLKQNYKKHNSQLGAKLPPTPPKLPIIGNLHQLGKLPHQSLWELSQRFGPVMLLHFGQKPTLIISSKDTAKQVLRTHDINFCTRPRFFGPMKLSYNFLDIAFSPHGDHWREMRKIFVTELLGPKNAQLFDRVRETEIDYLIQSLSSAPPNTAVNLDENLFDLVNGIVCSIAFGKSYRGGEFKNRKLKELLTASMEMLNGFSATDSFPLFGWIFDTITGWNARLEKCFRDLDGYFQMVLNEHLDGSTSQEKNGSHEGFVDMLVKLLKDETIGPFRLTKEDIKAILMNTLIGGVDTPFVTIVWAMSEIFKNPRIMHKVQTEIRTCINGRKQKVLDQDDISKMAYLQMAVKETFRLHPAAPFLIPHECMRHCKIDGYDVLPKTTVLINAWGIGRDPHTWKNPNEFWPERFEEIDFDFIGNNCEMVPFGAGRRMCPGLNMAIAMVELTLANLLYWFDWELPSGMKREDMSMEEEGGLVVRKKSPLCLVPIKHNWQD